jgi:hypothetical protein
MPTELVFSTGASAKVTAGVQEIADALESGAATLHTTRFAGFRGDEAVGGERVLVNLGAIAYATEIAAP